MAIYRPVHVTFWQDEKVIEEMTPEDKLFYLYLITNPNTTQIGIYKITKKQIAFEIGYSIESVNALMDRFINHHKLIIYNSETRELAIMNWGKYNFPRAGTPIENCVRKQLKEIIDKDLIRIVEQNIDNEKIKEIFKQSYEERDGVRDGTRDDVRNEKSFNKNENGLDTNIHRDGIRDEGNNKKQKTNNKKLITNNNNKEINLVEVVDEINKYFFLEDEDIKKVANTYLATGRDLDYLIEKLELVKNTPNVKNVVGYLLKAIQKDYKVSINQNSNSIPTVKTRFHNIHQTYSDYEADELERMLFESQKGKFN